MVLQTAGHQSINPGQGLVDLQTSQPKGRLAFQLQNRSDGSRVAHQGFLVALFLLSCGREFLYSALDGTDTTPPFFSSLLRELSSSHTGFWTALRKYRWQS